MLTDVLSQANPLLLLAGAALFLIAVVALTAVILRRPSGQGDMLNETVLRLADHQTELAGRLAQISEQAAIQQSQMSERLQAQERAITRTLEERLSDVSRRVGESLHKQATQTETTMGDLKERLAVIAVAQDRITQLSEQVVSLQDVLSNKQARGGFGETQLEDQVRSALPPSAYEFQCQLSNKTRVDCLLKLPNPPGPIAVDSKFPLESFNRIRATPDGDDRDRARKAFGRDVLKHVQDIAAKYILPGETSDCALMFLPSEAVYAELHAELPDVVDRAHKQRVYITSPTTLMALLNTIRAVLKDTEMREQAGVIQMQVHKMAGDVNRLDDRVSKLKTHFDQANEDIRQIQVSTSKIVRHAQKIADVELGEVDLVDAAGKAARPSAKPVGGDTTPMLSVESD